MRLINTHTLTLESFHDETLVPYAILSHRWEDGEVSLQDFVAGNSTGLKGFAKIEQASQLARRTGWKYIWIDTCCIDKTSSAELSECINSMYRWYQSAGVCYAYLFDIEWANELENSVWFERGWTLQELIAPKVLGFYNRYWKIIGFKSRLAGRIARKTQIPEEILLGGDPSKCSIAARMSWAANRGTTRSEDMAYCLMGLFQINMPMLYGEGHRAFIRLQEEIIKTSDDHSIFAWRDGAQNATGILAISPRYFQKSGTVRSYSSSSEAEPYVMTNVGLSIRLQVKQWAMHTYFAQLNCEDTSDLDVLLGIIVRRTSRPNQYVRLGIKRISRDYYPNSSPISGEQLLLLQSTIHLPYTDHLYGFVISNISLTFISRSAAETTPVYSLISTKPLKSGCGRIVHGSGTNRFLSYYKYSQHEDMRSARGSHCQDNLVFEFSEGAGGNLIGLLSDSQVTTSDGGSTGERKLACIVLGYDQAFEPICMLYDGSKVTEALSLICRVSTQHINNSFIEYGDASTSQSWSMPGMYGFRGKTFEYIPGLKLDVSVMQVPWGQNRFAWRVRLKHRLRSNSSRLE